MCHPLVVSPAPGVWKYRPTTLCAASLERRAARRRTAGQGHSGIRSRREAFPRSTDSFSFRQARTGSAVSGLRVCRCLVLSWWQPGRGRCGPGSRAPAMEGQRVEVDGGIMEGVSAGLCGARARRGGGDLHSKSLVPCALQGGQILRVSTALSCLLGLPLRVQKIRAGRSTPGLRYCGRVGSRAPESRSPGWETGIGARVVGQRIPGAASRVQPRPSFLSLRRTASCPWDALKHGSLSLVFPLGSLSSSPG